MKPLHFLLAATFSAVTLLAATPAQAQVNINITPPSWGPPVPATAQYYYIPDIDGYYDLRAQRYIVLRNGQWVPVTAVTGYSPGAFHPVVIDYVGATPWVMVREHRVKYPKTRVVKVVRPAPTRVVYRDRVTNLPPGQAKKIYGGKPGHGNGKGHGKHK